MIFNAYAAPNKDTLGLSVKSVGHIFAPKGRKILRPMCREDWLLFYVAAGGERFFSPHATAAKAKKHPRGRPLGCFFIKATSYGSRNGATPALRRAWR